MGSTGFGDISVVMARASHPPIGIRVRVRIRTGLLVRVRFQVSHL